MMGLTAHDYIQRRRLTEAAKLLVFSDKPILEIALLAGYESQQAFTGIFTALYKMPPNRYRENERFYPLQLKYSLEGSYSMLENKENRPGRPLLPKKPTFPAGWSWFALWWMAFPAWMRKNMSGSCRKKSVQDRR